MKIEDNKRYENTCDFKTEENATSQTSDMYAKKSSATESLASL